MLLVYIQVVRLLICSVNCFCKLVLVDPVKLWHQYHPTATTGGIYTGRCNALIAYIASAGN
ncbi:hypothetical protein BH09BAC1_BH09BAC1_15940 [soil metagenome]